MFIINSPKDIAIPQQWYLLCTYMIYQYERNPTTKTAYLIGYIIFPHSKTFATLKRLYPKAQWQQANGAPECYMGYCTKKCSRIDGPWERCTPSANGPEFRKTGTPNWYD